VSASVLAKILAVKAEEVARAKAERPAASLEAELAPSDRGFRDALAAPGGRFILEVKKASPSRGPIRPDLELEQLLALYDRHADAVSVLTDAPFFGGSPEDLRAARRLTRRPLLRKDFVIDPYQVAEARWLGADAVLLIVAALSDAQLVELREQALAYGMDALVEVHDEAELDRALAAGADLVGVNNRNLKDLSIDLAVTERLAGRLPEGVVTVSESGLETRADVLRLAPRADAFLIGSSILAAADMAAKVKELVYGRVKICGITRRADAEAALDAGASWLGFIFHPASPRCITPEACEELARGLGGVKVGVFVEQGIEEIEAIARRCRLHGVQLHGERDPAALRQLKARLEHVFVVQVLPVADAPPVLPDEGPVDYWLLDTADPTRHGGTGRRFDHGLLADLRRDDGARFGERVILAGGLDPDNIASAAALVPFALDLASGVEAEPGRKDRDKLQRLFAALR
jgi:indole-3-glycerol phosphate synthase/phosphoribosylanthranilate isomerase